MSGAEHDTEEGLIPRRATIVWIGLVVATIVTFWLGFDHPLGDGTAGLAAIVAIAIGVGKATAIGLEFMELRHAPPGLKYAFLAWCAMLGAGAILIRGL